MPEFAQTLGQTLLRLARCAIAEQLELSTAEQKLDLDSLPAIFQQPAATFVTLTKQGQLRACIGSLIARRPLARDVCDNACSAAFRDPRFPPLSADEFPHVRVEVSLLSCPTPLTVVDEADACRQLQPGIDGLILSASGHHATFLPQVWEQLPTPELFLQHLKTKAGMAADYWDRDLKLERYTVQKWKE